MAIAKKKVASAVSDANKAAKPAESVSNLDSLFVKPTNSNAAPTPAKKDLGTIEYLGKQRKLRRSPITWDKAYANKDMLYVIYFDSDCFSCIGNVADGIALRKQYPLEQGWFVNDQVLSSVHKYTIYKIHIHEIVDHVE